MHAEKKLVLAIWLTVMALALYMVIFQRAFIDSTLVTLLSGSQTTAYVVLLLLGALRGFTLVPVTILLVVGLLFLPALPLFCIIMTGVAISSASVYFFSEYLHLDTLFATKHKRLLEKGKAYLERYEFPVITIWSMAPFLPTDVISYLAGTLRINFFKFILGIMVGEGIVCAIYIWGGKTLARMLGFA